MNSKEAREFMLLSIEEMKRSVPEKRKDGKILPKVGAVLVMPDGKKETSYRGELRDGNHAEFTLLERKMIAENVSGSTLFTTLEPCTNKSRKTPKRGCSEHIIKARISTVYVGIEDPDPSVTGEGIKLLQDHGIEVQMYDMDLQEEITKQNTDFLEQARERALQIESEPCIADDTVWHDITLADLSSEALMRFSEKAAINVDNGFEPLFRSLEHTNVFKLGKDGALRASMDGILLFAEKPEQYYPQATIIASANLFPNDNETQKNFNGPLTLVLDQIEDWYEQVIPWAMNRNQAERTESKLYSYKPIREAVINAIAHRDYSIGGGKIHIRISSDCISIESPGLPPDPITFEQLRVFSAPSLSRNPKMSYVFRTLGYMEENQWGMREFASIQQRYGYLSPTFTYNAPYLCLQFPITIASKKEANVKYAQLSDEELLGYEFIKSQGKTTKAEYAQEMRLEGKTAQRQLSKMMKLGLIIDNGEAKQSKKYGYVINE